MHPSRQFNRGMLSWHRCVELSLKAKHPLINPMSDTSSISNHSLQPNRRKQERTISRKIILFWIATLVAFTAATMCPLSAQTTITFPQGKSAAAWSGFVKQDQVFRVYGKQGQRIYIEEGDMYSYAVTSPKGRVLNCDLVPYDKEVCELQRSRILPETGVYTVHVLYRMGGYPSGREVSTLITVRYE